MSLHLFRVRSPGQTNYLNYTYSPNGVGNVGLKTDLLINEYGMEVPGGDWKSMSFIASTLAQAHRELQLVQPQSVSVFEVDNVGTFNPYGKLAIFNRTKTYLKNRVPQNVRNVDAYTFDSWELKPGSSLNQFVWTQKKVKRFTWPMIFEPSYMPTGTRFPAFGLGNENIPIGLMVMNNTVSGCARKQLYRGALRVGDYTGEGNNKYQLHAYGMLGARTWKRYKKCMSSLIPYMSSQYYGQYDEPRLAGKRKGSLVAHRVIEQRNRARRRAEREPSGSYVQDMMWEIIERYSNALVKCTEAKLLWSHNIASARVPTDALMEALGVMELFLAFLVSLSENKTRTIQSLVGYIPYNALGNFAQNHSNNIKLYDIEELIIETVNFYQNVRSAEFDKIPTINSVGATQLTIPLNGKFTFALHDIFWYSQDKGNDKNLNNINRRYVDGISNNVCANWVRWHEVVFQFNRVLAYAEKIIDAKPIGPKRRTVKPEDKDVNYPGGFVWSGGRLGLIPEKAGVAYRPANVQSPLTGWKPLESQPQITLLNDSLDKQQLLYALHDFDKRPAVVTMPIIIDSEDDDDDEEGEEGEEPGEQYWYPVIYPLDPDEERAERLQVLDQIVDNLTYVADGVAVVEIFLTDGLATPAVAVQRELIIDGMKAGIKLL